MTGAAKMLLIANAKRGGMYNEMRGESTSMEAMGHYPPMYNEPESRRRRDSRGRYTSAMDGGEARYEMNGGTRMEAEDRQPMQIGFRYEEDAGRYHTDTGYPRMNETEHRRSKMDKGHAMGSGHGKLDRKAAEEWVGKMKTAEGYKGKKWGIEQSGQIMMQMGIDCDPLEFFVAMNMMVSDYGKVAEEMGIDNEYFYAQMAKAFLKDPDAVPDKLALYYECIAK